MAVQFVKKWGNRPAVRIPAAIMESAAPDPDLEELLTGISPENRHSEADFGAPQGREFL